MKIEVRWVITEEHKKTIEVDDDFDPDDVETDLDSLLAEIEDNDSWVATTERDLVSWEKVDD